jgi:hypothetical protein
MKNIIQSMPNKFTTSFLKTFVMANATLSLMGCYVEVYDEHEAGYYTEVNYSDITDMRTQFIVDAAILPIALAAEAPYQVIDPDSYTSPRSGLLSRAPAVIETTYAYLFDDVDCAEGGYTAVEAEADTTSYDDGYTYVDIQTSAQAHHCEVWRGRDLATINSDLSYDTTGWYDDIEHELSSMDSELNGEFTMNWAAKEIRHRNIEATVTALSHNDIAIDVESSVRLDNGYDVESPSMVTLDTIHWYLGDTHPHQGEIKFIQGLDWVKLTFESDGLWRSNRHGYSNFWTWSELGY